MVEEKNCQGIYVHEHNRLGECGRYRIDVTYYVKCIKFWFEIVTSENSLIKSCHLGLCKQVELGKINCASKEKLRERSLFMAEGGGGGGVGGGGRATFS